MKPLNQKERNSAFIKYLLGLSICIGLFCIVFFVGSNISVKEMEVLRKQNTEYKNMADKQAKMISMMDSIESNLAILDRPDANATYTETVVSNLMIQMNNELTDSSSANLVYKKIAADYKKMMDDKGTIRNMKKDQEAGGDCSKQLEQAKRDIMEYQKMLTSAGMAVPK